MSVPAPSEIPAGDAVSVPISSMVPAFSAVSCRVSDGALCAGRPQAAATSDRINAVMSTMLLHFFTGFLPPSLHLKRTAPASLTVSEKLYKAEQQITASIGAAVPHP